MEIFFLIFLFFFGIEDLLYNNAVQKLNIKLTKLFCTVVAWKSIFFWYSKFHLPSIHCTFYSYLYAPNTDTQSQTYRERLVRLLLGTRVVQCSMWLMPKAKWKTCFKASKRNTRKSITYRALIPAMVTVWC